MSFIDANILFSNDKIIHKRMPGNADALQMLALCLNFTLYGITRGVSILIYAYI